MRVAGVTIPDSKRLAIGLTQLYGVGVSRAEKILADAGIDKNKKPTDLSSKDEADIRERLEGFVLEGDLRRSKSGNIKRLKDTKAYRGVRHSTNLPTTPRLRSNSTIIRTRSVAVAPSGSLPSKRKPTTSGTSIEIG